MLRGKLIGRWFAGALIAAAYVPVAADLMRLWSSHPYAGHGMFVPAFSAIVAWSDRNRLRAAAGSGHPGGVALVALALAGLALGRWKGNIELQALSLVFAVAGATMWWFGVACFRAALFPIGFLIFMIPLPRGIIDAVTVHLQLFAASFAGLALDLLGIPFYLDGLLIHLPHATLAVAEVCNGLRFLTGLVVLTMAFAEVSQHRLWAKIVLVVSAVPVAILANAVRVAAVSIAVYYFGAEAASGFVHNSIGKLVWALTLISLGVLGLVLRAKGRSDEKGVLLATPDRGG
jgi:exosortase